jgi:glycosyltransferase involved in cell wall biosynthesis
MTPSAERQRLCIVVPTAASHDSRTRRIASSVAARGHDVVVLARSPGAPAPGGAAAEASAEIGHDGYRTTRVGTVAARPLPAPLRIVDRARATRRQRDAARVADRGADVYHGMAFMGIPVALDLARRQGARTVYDARDLYADARSIARLPGPLRRVVRARERGWARQADRVVTVNDGLAGVLAERFGIERPAVVMNCPPRWTPDPTGERRLHARLGLPADARIVLYHGGLEPGRGVEQLLAAGDLGPAVHIILLGYGSLLGWLDTRLAADPALGGRVHVLPAVPPEELLAWVHGADVVAMPIQPSTLNHRLSTPNKLFEALGAGVPVVASDFAPMRQIVIDDPDGPLGAVCDPTDPAAIASAIRSLLDLDEPASADLRARCLRAAHARYAWEMQLDVLLATYASLTGRPW